MVLVANKPKVKTKSKTKVKTSNQAKIKQLIKEIKQDSDKSLIEIYNSIRKSDAFKSLTKTDIHINGNIYRTNDYDKFKFAKENRNISRSHVNRLKKEIREQDLQQPIKVMIKKDAYYIIDGQNRFTAYKELGMKFLYEIDNNLEINDVQKMNKLTKHWNRHDYAKHLLHKTGNQAYRVYLDLVDEHGFSSQVATAILTGQRICQRRNDDFMKGELRTISKKDREEILNMILAYKDIGITYWRSRSFVYALLEIRIQSPTLINGLFKAIQHGYNKMRNEGGLTAFVDLFEKLYNEFKQPPHKVRLVPLDVKKKFPSAMSNSGNKY